MTKKSLAILGAIALFALNLGFIAFYALWMNADSAAITAMENGSGMDAAQMLPNANLMWVAANGSLVALILVDLIALVLAAAAFSTRRTMPQTRVSGSAATSPSA